MLLSERSGFSDALFEKTSAGSYALRMAKYITDASVIRVRTLEMYGNIPSVPTREQIQKMIDENRHINVDVDEEVSRYNVNGEEIARKKPGKVFDFKEYETETPEQLCLAVCDMFGIDLACIMSKDWNMKSRPARACLAALLYARGMKVKDIAAFIGRTKSPTANIIARFPTVYMKVPLVKAIWKHLAPDKFKDLKVGQAISH